MNKARKLPFIDILQTWCHRQGLQASREVLLAAIACGDVMAGAERCRDPRSRFNSDIPIGLSPNSPLASQLGGGGSLIPHGVPGLPYVSRGGEKLQAVLRQWQVRVVDRVWLDAGCSTGGFSHCLLLNGARIIHAVDVGYNVLDWRLRQLPQIRLHERCNIMALTVLDPQPHAAVADLSFRSMQGAAAQILSLVSDNELYALIKPQFERKYLPDNSPADLDDRAIEAFSGVVGPQETRRILADVARRLAGDGIAIRRILPAGLRGRSGNQEYIAELALADAGDRDLAATNLACLDRLDIQAD